MKITIEYLQSKYACEEGLEYFKDNYTEIEHFELISQLNIKNKHTWSNWLISKLLTNNAAAYAANAAANAAAYKEMLEKIINYGLELIEKQEVL